MNLLNESFSGFAYRGPDGRELWGITASLPWHLAPSDLAFSGAVAGETFDSAILVGHPEHGEAIARLVRDSQRLVSLGPLEMLWGPVLEASKTCRGSDRLQLRWDTNPYWRSFAELSVPCNVREPQTFALDARSRRDWGQTMRLVRGRSVFAPSPPKHGGETMESIIERANREQLVEIPLTANFASGSRYPLLTMAYHVCVDMDVVELSRRIESVLTGNNPAAVAAEAALVIQSLAMGENPMKLEGLVMESTINPASGGALWPVASCVDHRTDGSCVVHFGYVLTGEMAVQVEEGPDNFLSPSELASHARPPQRFSPGFHENELEVRYLCESMVPGEWNDLRWNLAGLVAVVTRRTPTCDSPSLHPVDHVTPARARPGLAVKEPDDTGQDAASMAKTLQKNLTPSQ